jgi:CheY-like chemotaxis protein
MKRILVVDDDPHIRFIIETILTGEGYEVGTADSGDEALRASSKRPYDLVLTDLILPGIDGIETILRLRAMQPELRTIAMSGGWNGGVHTCQPLAGKLGVCRTLAKPFDRMTLLNAIELEVGSPLLAAV